MSVLSKDQVTVVLPTLNEEKAIGLVIDELRMEGYNNIIVVDGYSTDNTVRIAMERGVKVVYQYGRGKAGAIRTAIDFVNTPFVVFMDADGTYDARDVERLLRYASDYDEVIGFRSDRHNIPLLHRFGNRVISVVLSLLVGCRVGDPCSGMYLLRTDVAKNLELISEGFAVEAEIAAQLASLGRVAEVPVRYRKRVGGSKLRTWRAGLSILLTVFRVAWLYSPAFLLSALASLFAIPGAAIIFWQLYLRHAFGAERWSLGWSWLGLTLLIVGLQGFTVATISLLLKRFERRILAMLRRGR